MERRKSMSKKKPTMQVKRKMTEKPEREVSVADIASICNLSTTKICTILKNERLSSRILLKRNDSVVHRTATVATRKIAQHLLSVPLLDGSTKNSMYFCIQQMAAPQLLHQAHPNSKRMARISTQLLDDV
ncbi:hypothetical protein AVEN_232216-1 [Araneus ventricosus]|uniref:Uncharacterized protein n=1 Tax=Araneus ventricosus TaxID=182803 RepID=A0A4Y2RY73_ARAVE|nr:hypothetical protein AVEN_232216-1 [Araneus ventricosus]